MGSSTIGKGDTSRPGVRGDKKSSGYKGYGVYTEKTYSNIGAKGNNLAGSTSIASNPTVMPGKGNPPSNLPKPTNVATVTPVKTKNIPRSYVPSRIKQIFDPTPFATPVVKKPPAKKPVSVAKRPPAVVSNVVREKMSPTQNSSFSKKPPATRFGTVTGKTTGTRVSGGGGYGGGGTRGGGSLSGGGSGTRSAGTSRTGGTRSNSPVRG